MNLILLFTLSWLAACATHSNQSSVAQIPAVHISRLEEAIKFRDIAAKEVWPGFENYNPSVVYFTDSSQFLFNPRGAPPDEYIYIGEAGPSWGLKVFKAKFWSGPDGKELPRESIQNEFIGNAFAPEDTNLRFKFSVFFVDSLEQFNAKGNKWSLDDWYTIFWHEVFHNFQDTLYDQSLIPDQVRSLKPLEALLKSESFLKKVRSEQKVLAEVLLANNLKQKSRMLCRNFLSLRKARYGAMSEEAAVSEQFNEISEGTARYVEELSATAMANRLRTEKKTEQDAAENFHFFKKYAQSNSGTYAISIQNISPENIYFYNSGFALALVLDQIKPDWKVTSFRRKGFLFGEVQSWCQNK